MTPLRQRMLEDMQVRNLSPNTQRAYVESVARFDVMHHGKRYRMAVDAFALVRGATQPVSSKQEAEKVWEPKFIGEIVSGRDPRKPPAPPATEGMTVAAFLDQYYERYVVAESLRSIASIRSRLASLKEALGAARGRVGAD